MAILPTPQLPGEPRGILVAMAEEAAIGAFLLAEPHRHVELRNVINLVRPGRKQDAVHDPRHVTSDAAAGLRSRRMMRVRLNGSREFLVTRQTHLVGPVQVL